MATPWTTPGTASKRFLNVKRRERMWVTSCAGEAHGGSGAREGVDEDGAGEGHDRAIRGV